MVKFVFKISRWQHKTIGLTLMLYLIMMSMTGILLNHPGAIQGISLPLSWLPSNYLYQNWNRGLINDAVLSANGNRLLLAGKEGVWLAHNETDGINFEALDGGYPTAAYNKNTSSVIEVPGANGQILMLAAARSDVLVFSPDTQRWQSTEFPHNTGTIKKLLYHDHTTYAVTEKGIYASSEPFIKASWEVLPIELPGDFKTVPLFRFLFKLHDGSLFGLVGKLLFDLAALAIIYLCVSGIKMWLFPKRAMHASGKLSDRVKKDYVTATRRHLSIGIYAVPLLLVFALTGLFMRPPLLIVIARKMVPAKYMYPLSAVPSQPTLESAAIDISGNRFLVLTRQGLFEGPLDTGGPFEAKDIRLPIHGMGATIFQHFDEDEVLVGSFSGLYRCNTETGQIRTFPDNSPPARGAHGRPGIGGVMALSVERGKNLFYVGYHKGLIITDSVSQDSWLRQLKMPEGMNRRTGISLWHCLFEIHNGRYFRNFVGIWFILIVPLGALAFTIIILTGFYDWLYRKKLSKKRHST